DQIADRRLQPGLLEGGEHQIALPFAVARLAPMLDGAAAADAEMRTEGCDALGARRQDAQQVPAVRMAGYALRFAGLAGQRVGNEGGPGGCVDHAVAAMGEAVDDETFGHGHGLGAVTRLTRRFTCRPTWPRQAPEDSRAGSASGSAGSAKPHRR